MRLKKINFTLLLVLVSMFSVVKAKESNGTIEFKGRWCGEWDDKFQTCFTIDKHDGYFSAFYEWEEFIGGGFQKKTIRGKRLNDNTLDFKGKILIFNLKNPDQAVAMGIFRHHSRVAELKRQTSN
ncbi:hypothetical protein [Pleionea sediminis]|uniref:hypothetical protein n=1 Tax=Pleionea sediminis TaxID=2569479 RepID=UPI001184E9DE|nr:hypothetical protein [Pleionea sediminis]